MDEVILNVQHALTAGRSGKHGPLLRQGLAGERGQAHREDACLKCQLLGPAAPAQYAPALGNNGDRVSAGASSAAVPPQTESVYQVKPEVRYLRPLARASLAAAAAARPPSGSRAAASCATFQRDYIHNRM